MTGSRRLAPVLATALAAFGVAACGLAAAQDPAYIGGSSNNDPANFSQPRQQRRAPVQLPAGLQGFDPRTGQFAPPAPMVDPASQPMSPQETTRQVQGMIDQLNNNLASGSRHNPYDRSKQYRYDQAMRQAETLMSRNSNQFTPATKALFMEMQRLDEEQRRELATRENADFEDPNIAMDRSMRQAEDGMRRLGDVLMPMLQDAKRAADTELRNAATRR
ncbi:MAG: hypothetical protein KA144_02100 [Xanthomonadaceae bacterium]|nr:hypothetical protein [Xanthomonadaceae bacterium]